MSTIIFRIFGKVISNSRETYSIISKIFSFDEKEKKTMIDELCQPQRSTVLINYRHLSNFNDRLARVLQDEYYR